MTHKRTWLALGALLTAIIGGTLWAGDQEKKATEEPRVPDVKPAEQCLGSTCYEVKVLANDKPCCEEKCAAKEKPCCAEKCGTKEQAKGCCADGKCCGCCDKGKPGVTLPILPGSTFELLISPPATAGTCVVSPPCVDGSYPMSWSGISPPLPPPAPQPAPSVQYTPVTQYVPTLTNPSSQPCLPPQCAYPAPVMPSTAAPWRLRTVAQKDHTCLEMQLSAGGEDACAYCDNMVLKIGNEKLKVCVADKQIQVNGSFVKGSADSVTRNTADGSILFEGHVKLTYEKAGQKAEVSAERVLVGVADGRLEVKPVEQSPQQQVFSFWTGFAR